MANILPQHAQHDLDTSTCHLVQWSGEGLYSPCEMPGGKSHNEQVGQPNHSCRTMKHDSLHKPFHFLWDKLQYYVKILEVTLTGLRLLVSYRLQAKQSRPGGIVCSSSSVCLFPFFTGTVLSSVLFFLFLSPFKK